MVSNKEFIYHQFTYSYYNRDAFRSRFLYNHHYKGKTRSYRRNLDRCLHSDRETIHTHCHFRCHCHFHFHFHCHCHYHCRCHFHFHCHCHFHCHYHYHCRCHCHFHCHYHCHHLRKKNNNLICNHTYITGLATVI